MAWHTLLGHPTANAERSQLFCSTVLLEKEENMGEGLWLEMRDEGASSLVLGMSRRGSLNLNMQRKARRNLKAQSSLTRQNVFDANSISVLKQLQRYLNSWHQLTISRNWHDDSNQTEFIALGLIPLPDSSCSQKCNRERVPTGMVTSSLR